MFRLFILILLGFSVIGVCSRPSQSAANENQEDLEYEEDGSPSDDNMEDSRFGDEDASNLDLDQSRRLLEMNRNNYLQKNLAEDQVPRTNMDTPDYKPSRTRDARNNKLVNNNDEYQPYGKRRRYIDNANEQSEIAQRPTNRDVNNFKSNRMHNEMLLENPFNKKNFESQKARLEDSDLLFENNNDQTSKVDRSEIDEPAGANQQSSYTKQYYNKMQPDTVALDINSRGSDFMYYNRERREANKSNPGDSENIASIETEKENLEKLENENEEMAIKRHIKKMTSDELEQLLNSLSEEKKALLKKIMDDDEMPEKSLENINKREITKKAGAVEDNGYMDSGQSESSKMQGSFSAIDVTTAFPATQGMDGITTKQTENQPDTTVLANHKPTPSTENKAENNDSPEKSFTSDVEPSKTPAEIASNEQPATKNENKRETNTEVQVESLEENQEIAKSENDEVKEIRSDDSYFFPHDEDMSQVLDDVEESRTYDTSNIYKREVENQSELDSRLKSLEESFPNSDVYDESGPYSGPLIRVKRKNSDPVMKKRSAAVLPDAKVGYYPSKSDNSDEDSDEGNEFDDDGFYDPSPNLVNNDNSFVTNSEQKKREGSCKLNSKYQAKTLMNDGTMNLGSDTDNVLSGVEGVDENLMYNGASRNRRKTDANIAERVDENSLVQSALSKTLNSDAKANNGIDIPNYQDNDSFGGYPRSYEGDLSRYKRVRRVKQSHVTEAPAA